MGEHPVGVESVLDDSARRTCKTLAGSLLSRSFYLAGGTGLAVQLRHRVSLDLDFFSIRPSERVDSSLVASSLGKALPRNIVTLETSQIDQSTWTVRSTKVSFIAYPFPLLDEPVDGSAISDGLADLQIASVRDIACMKAYALGRRTAFRDYVDLYFILRKTGITLDSLVADCEKKFVLGKEKVFSTKLFLEQLVYTEDIPDRDAALRLISEKESLTAQGIDEYLRGCVQRFADRETGDSGGGLP